MDNHDESFAEVLPMSCGTVAVFIARHPLCGSKEGKLSQPIEKKKDADEAIGSPKCLAIGQETASRRDTSRL